MVYKYGGRIVGIYEKETKLIDGEYYDVKLYEMTRNNYCMSRGANNTEIQGVDLPESVFKARLLTDGDVDKWEEYRDLE